MPFGLSGFEDEIIFERVFGGLVVAAPAVEKEKPGFLGLAGEDEGLGAGAVFDGIFGRGGAAFGRSGAGAATIAFFGFGFRLLIGSDRVVENLGVAHLLSELSVDGGRSG